MTQASFLNLTKAIQALGTIGEAGTTQDQSDQGSTTDTTFETMLSGLVKTDQANKVSEEALFAGLIEERITKLKGADLGKQYHQMLMQHERAIKMPDGYVSYEEAGRGALYEMVSSGILTTEEGDKIQAQAFSACQLDNNHEKIWDNRGGKNDHTIAVDTLENALLLARAKIESFDSAVETPEVDSAAPLIEDSNGNNNTHTSEEAAAPVTVSQPAVDSNTQTSEEEEEVVEAVVPTPSTVSEFIDQNTPTITPRSTVVDGPTNFLFKPISSGDGNLAVLLPNNFAHLVEAVTLKDENGRVLDRGRSTGYGETGVQEKFSFSKPGAKYPNNLKVEVRMLDGSIVNYEIPDPAKRYD